MILAVGSHQIYLIIEYQVFPLPRQRGADKGKFAMGADSGKAGSAGEGRCVSLSLWRGIRNGQSDSICGLTV